MTENKQTILVVEDSKPIALTQQDLLETAGYRVLLAYTGEEAIEIAKTMTFDFIFMDLGLPGIDGYETTKQIRANGYAGPIVALTGRTSGGDKELAAAAGMNDYLIKPVDFKTMKATIAKHTSIAA
jgi:CheY-like chemotaxis protein